MSEYDLKHAQAPRLTGLPLRMFAATLERRLPRALIQPKLFRDLGLDKFRALELSEAPTLLPLVPGKTAARRNASVAEIKQIARISYARNGFQFPTAGNFTSAYKSGQKSPLEIAQVLANAIEQSERNDPPLRAIIAFRAEDLLEQARASESRYKRGKPIGPLDGVPIAVKDELHQVPYPTTVGTKFFGHDMAMHDATLVKRLRDQGALLIGKANMHEIGIGVLGHNPHFGPPRNPYHPMHYTGGSSSGSGAAVAAGLGPISIGADGGGSIRIPAALCGVYGIKATFGRISEHGAVPLCWSVAHAGPLAATARDLALAYAVVAGPDKNDPNSLKQPNPSFTHLKKKDARGIKLGIYEPWFKDADPQIVRACEAMREVFERSGARVIPIEIPNLDSIRAAHAFTIASEMATFFDAAYKDHRTDFSLDVRVNLAMARSFTSRDYVKAQRVRTRAMADFAAVFEKVDAVLTPTTGVVAPELKADAVSHGESNLTVLTDIMRFAVQANMTGNPAISFPVGYTDKGLPIGMQAIGRHWEEDLLLRLAMVSEMHLERRAPHVFFDLLA